MATDKDSPESPDPAPRRSPWYLLGLGAQLGLWVLVLLSFVLAYAANTTLTDFRYVGF